MKFNSLHATLFGLILFSCAPASDQTSVPTLENDLIPEGIAVDVKSGRFFLSSLKKNKIVTANLDGSNGSDFISSGQFDYQSGFGMTIKGDTLYALSNGLIKKENTSVLLLLNIKTGQLIEQYKLNISPYAYLNDLAVSNNNEIFITDSESNKVYIIKRPGKTLEVFFDIEDVPHSNGIAISDDNTRLFLASKKGIRVADIRTKSILSEPHLESAGIDGMKFYKNSLIGMMDPGLYRFFLNKEGTAIVSKQEMIRFDNTFRAPTTFDIQGNQLYFIKNTQLDNYNDSTNEIVEKNKLQTLVLLKMKIADQ